MDDFFLAADGRWCAAELHVYPDAPQSFFDRGYGDFAPECADAWQRVLCFTAGTAGTVGTTRS